jgi:hypothetical protein
LHRQRPLYGRDQLGCDSPAKQLHLFNGRWGSQVAMSVLRPRAFFLAGDQPEQVEENVSFTYPWNATGERIIAAFATISNEGNPLMPIDRVETEGGSLPPFFNFGANRDPSAWQGTPVCQVGNVARFTSEDFVPCVPDAGKHESKSPAHLRRELFAQVRLDEYGKMGHVVALAFCCAPVGAHAS